MEHTEREKDLILSALCILEGQCVGDELHFDTESDLGGTLNWKEVRDLMDKIKGEA